MQKSKLIKIGVSCALVVVIGVGSYSAYTYFQRPSVDAAAFEEVSLTEKAAFTKVKETITASGMVYLEDEHEIYAEGETNKIKEFLVEEGDYVEEGQLLVNYDIEDTKEEYENKIKESQTTLENEKLSLENIVLPLSEDERITLEGNINQAEKSLYDAQTNFDDYKNKIEQQQITINNAKKTLEKAEKNVSDNEKLLEVGALTQSEYDDSVDAVDKAKESYDNELLNLESIKKEQTSAQFALKAAENSLAEAKNKLKLAEDVFSDEATVIKYKQQQNQIKLTEISLTDYKKKLNDLVYSTSSPVSGIVTEISVDEGTYTEENTVMLKIADFNKLIVKASIAEYDAPNVSVGQKVEMTSDGLTGKLYTGTITKVNQSASSADTNMGSETVVPIEISVDNPDGVLKPGYNLDLEIISVDKESALTVSTSAVEKDTENNKYYVYVVGEGNKIRKTEIETGVYGEVQVEVLSGIEEGTDVIMSPVEGIHDGMDMEQYKAIAATAKALNAQTNSSKEKQEQGATMFGGAMPGGNMGSRGGMGGGPR